MAPHDPIFEGKWTLKRFNSIVISTIWQEVLFFTLFATMVTLVSKFTSHQLVIPSGLLTVLGTVLGLVISFRTSSAYERYQDGRRMWTNIMTASRNLAMMFWIHVPSERTAEGLSQEQAILQGVIEKKTMINLIQAYSVSVKHFLRGEPGVYYEDLYPLVSFLPRYTATQETYEADKLPLWSVSDEIELARLRRYQLKHPDKVHSQGAPVQPGFTRDNTLVSNPSWIRSFSKDGPAVNRRKKFDPEKVLPEVDSAHPLKPARNPPVETIFDIFPYLKLLKWVARKLLLRAEPEEEREERQLRHKIKQESNVPLEICLVISSYTASLMQRGLLQAAIATGMTNNITLLQDNFSNLERIKNTPLPFAYQVHLRMSLWFYLLFLPFQIYSTFGYITIPGTTFASFLLLGFLEIGQEIEDPFNYDLNDLDLDHFCLSIQRELHQITASPNPEPSSFIFSAENYPFAPSDRRNAAGLIQEDAYKIPDQKVGPEPGLPSIRRTLVNSWREVDRETRRL